MELTTNLIRDKVEECYQAAEKHYGQTFPRPELLFNLRGTRAGVACYRPYGTDYIRINLDVFAAYPETYLNRTTPHEVAHLIARRTHNYKIKSHGPEWQSVMGMFYVYGLTDGDHSRCHNYEVTPARKTKPRARPHLYTCTNNNCKKEYHVTNLIHRRNKERGAYLCGECRSPIRYVETVEEAAA